MTNQRRRRGRGDRKVNDANTNNPQNEAGFQRSQGNRGGRRGDSGRGGGVRGGGDGGNRGDLTLYSHTAPPRSGRHQPRPQNPFAPGSRRALISQADYYQQSNGNRHQQGPNHHGHHHQQQRPFQDIRRNGYDQQSSGNQENYAANTQSNHHLQGCNGDVNSNAEQRFYQNAEIAAKERAIVARNKAYAAYNEDVEMPDAPPLQYSQSAGDNFCMDDDLYL
ncbi:hypothetical protein EDC01DRAFT_751476 [Geopyxis carbonaria]|nr:hypothetical protein EDC01DRAFT_751476 [Geopyxis carbonaria]